MFHYFTVFTAMPGPSMAKPIAILFYQSAQDQAFNLTERDAQTRITELGKSYDVRYHKVNSIFEAKQIAETTLAGSGRKFAHLEFAGHGNETQLIFNENTRGGIISPNNEVGKEELKALIEMVADDGIIVSQSCSNGSTKLKEKNVLEYLADFTKPGQRVIGASDKLNMFHMDSIRHFHLVQNLSKNRDPNEDRDITTIYLKTVNGDVRRVNIDSVDFLFSFFDRDPDKADLCYELIASSADLLKRQELVDTHCPDLSPRLQEYFLNFDIKKRPGTEWAPMLDDLERLASKLGWSGDLALQLTSEERKSFTPEETSRGITYESHTLEGLYPAAYKFLLALAEFDHYYDLLRLLDNGKNYNDNPAALPVYRLTGHIWHPDLQPLGVVRQNLDTIKRSYALVKEQGDDKLVEWFKKAFGDGCFEVRLNHAHGYYIDNKLIELDPLFEKYTIFSDDSLSVAVEKTHAALLENNYRLLGIEKNPTENDPKYPIFEYLRRESILFNFLKVQLKRYQLAEDKFSDEAIVEEIKRGGVCAPEDEVPGLIDQIARRDFGSLIQFNQFIERSLMELARSYPDQAAPYLKDLGLTATEAIQFCIDHQIKKIFLSSYGVEITDEMINQLKTIEGLTYIELIMSESITEATIDSIAQKYPNIEIISSIDRKLAAIREAFPNMPIIGPEFWKSHGVSIEDIPELFTVDEIRTSLEKLNAHGVEGIGRVDKVKDYAGATLMLLPKGLSFEKLMDMGVKFRGQNNLIGFIDSRKLEDVKFRIEYHFVMDSIQYKDKQCWVLISNGILNESRNKEVQVQKNMVRDLGGEMPGTFDVVTLAGVTFLTQGQKRLFGDSPLTYSRCKEQFQGREFIVGGFFAEGIFVICRDTVDPKFGVAFALRK